MDRPLETASGGRVGKDGLLVGSIFTRLFAALLL
jgi:hypothetical protein